MRIRQVHLVIELGTQSPPIELHERVLLGNFPLDLFGYSCAFPEVRQVQLAHFSVAAHVVHQVERIPFAADKRHGFTSDFRHFVVYRGSTTPRNIRCAISPNVASKE